MVRSTSHALQQRVVGKAACLRSWQALESLELELDSVDATRRRRSRRFTHAGASKHVSLVRRRRARHAILPRVTGQGDDELRARLRAIRVFEGDLPTFDVGRATEDPVELLLSWLVSAIDAGTREPHAMTLSTVDADGRPSSRVLILKGVMGGLLQFATSRLSRKGAELDAMPYAAANFYWPELGRPIRVRGRVMMAAPLKPRETSSHGRTDHAPNRSPGSRARSSTPPTTSTRRDAQGCSGARCRRPAAGARALDGVPPNA